MTNEVLANQINNAIGAHGSWKIKLRSAVKSGQTNHSIQETRCDNKCAFGAWLHGVEIDNATRQSIAFRVVKRLHVEFHVSAAEVLQLVTKGHLKDAEEFLNTDFSARSAKLVLALQKWQKELFVV